MKLRKALKLLRPDLTSAEVKAEAFKLDPSLVPGHDKHAGVRACEERIAIIYSQGLPQVDPEAYRHALVSGKTNQPVPPPPQKTKRQAESWANVIAEELSQEGIVGVSARREIIQRVKALAKAGVPWAVMFLADREDGKPKQMVDLDAKGGGAVTVNLVSFGQATVVNPAPSLVPGEAVEDEPSNESIDG